MKIVDSVVYLFSFFQLYGQFRHFIYKLSGTLSYFYNEIFGETKNEESFELEVFRAEAQNLVTQLEKIERNSESVGCLLLSKSPLCIICGTETSVEKKFYDVTVHDCDNGTQHGRRYARQCRSWNITENCGYYVNGNVKYLNLKEFFQQKYFLSTEDTAFSLKMMQKYDYELVIANMPF